MKDLQKELVKRKLDCALFLTYEQTNPNLFYFTSYVGAGALIIPAKGKAILHVPSRDLTQARSVKGVELSSGKKLSEVFASIGNVKNIGLDFVNTSVYDFNNLKNGLKCDFFDITEFMNKLRVIKDNNEIAKISKACQITDKVFSSFVKNFKNFKTEQEAAAFLVYETRKMGCGVAFEPIVASGKNAAVPHHVPYGKIMKGFCVVDYGVKYQGYCSDMTRTFYVGKPTKEVEKIYNDLLESQEKTVNFVKPGVTISDLSLASEKMTGPLIHSLGHGMGIEVHEYPNVSNNNKDVLREGMVITIEPGVYVPGKYGIRIEDDVLVTKKGFKFLSKFPKKLIIVK